MNFAMTNDAVAVFPPMAVWPAASAVTLAFDPADQLMATVHLTPHIAVEVDLASEEDTVWVDQLIAKLSQIREEAARHRRHGAPLPHRTPPPSQVAGS